MAEAFISKELVQHVAKLARLELSEKQIDTFQPQLSSVLGYMSKIQSLNTEGVPETAQVTGLENVWREDAVEKARMFSQKQALSNAARTHDGFFVIGAVLKEF
jgi:aspartyl-tRNA(Asn)/glutamyl-tRNA(Gln) amidotransferase subunit C